MRGSGGRAREGEYERYRELVLRMLAKRFPRIDVDERLAIYHEAWVRALTKRERGEKIESLRAYLLATAGGEALHALSRGKPPMPVGPDDPRVATLADERPGIEDEVVVRDQARIARNLLETLDQRQRDVLKLRWDLQLSAEEIRAALGLSRRQYQRLAEEGAAAVAERVRELESGEWSRRQRSLLTACLVDVPGNDSDLRAGIATRKQREQAQRLLESDPHVAALYTEVREALRRATVLLPLPVFIPKSSVSPLHRLPELASEARDQIAGAIDAVKQQATSLYLRAADPTLLTGGPRPGVAAVAIVGCLAAGSGAYGVHKATSEPPARPAVSVQPAQSQAAATARALASTTSGLPRPTTPRKPRQPKPPKDQPVTTPSPQPISTPQPAPPSPTPTQPTNEFGFED